MLFWKRKKYSDHIMFLSLLGEFGSYFLFINLPFVINVIFYCYFIFYSVILLTISSKAYSIHSSIIINFIFYSGLCVGLFFAHNFNSQLIGLIDHNIIYLLLISLVSICFKVLCEIAIHKNPNAVLLSNSDNFIKFNSLFPFIAKYYLNVDPKNLQSSVNTLNKLINNKKVGLIYTDTIDNTYEILQLCPDKPQTKTNIICLECNNQPLYKQFLINHSVNIKHEEIGEKFKITKVLLICNDIELLNSFLSYLMHYNPLSLVILTDNFSIAKSLKHYYNVFIYSENVIENIFKQHTVDFVIDAFIINKNNFYVYVPIINAIAEYINDIKFITSIVKTGFLLDDWLLNQVKENILYAIKESNSMLSVNVLRVGEFQLHNLIRNYNEIICFKNFYFMKTFDIAHTTLELINHFNRDNLSIFSPVHHITNDLETDKLIKLYEIDSNISCSVEFITNQKVEAVELFTQKLYIHKYVFKHNTKLFVSQILSGKEMTFEELIMHIIY